MPKNRKKKQQARKAKQEAEKARFAEAVQLVGWDAEDAKGELLAVGMDKKHGAVLVTVNGLWTMRPEDTRAFINTLPATITKNDWEPSILSAQI